jgi:hypothetical protein
MIINDQWPIIQWPAHKIPKNKFQNPNEWREFRRGRDSKVASWQLLRIENRASSGKCSVAVAVFSFIQPPEINDHQWPMTSTLNSKEQNPNEWREFRRSRDSKEPVSNYPESRIEYRGSSRKFSVAVAVSSFIQPPAINDNQWPIIQWAAHKIPKNKFQNPNEGREFRCGRDSKIAR